MVEDAKKQDVILLFSGGLDSFIAYHFLGKPKCVYFDIGLPICKEEIRVIRELGIPVIIDTSVNLADREVEGDSKFIPGRNLYYALLACKYGDEIYMAGLRDDVVNDKNEPIFQEFSRILSVMYDRTIKVLSPFWDMTKADIVKWYLEEVGDIESLIKTGSCYDLTDGNYCGKCRCCFRKWVALWINGIKLPFYNRNLIAEYFKKARAGVYDKQRNQNIIKTVRGYLNKQTYCIDIDGVLTNETAGHDYSARTPNQKNIDKVRELYRFGHHIVLWTSRFPEDENVTKKWLEENGVRYHELLLGKLQYDFLVDDKVTFLGGVN